MQPNTQTIPMDPFALFNGVQEYTPRKSIVGEPSKEKEQSHQYSPRPAQPLSASTSPRDSPKASDFKKRKRGRPPLEKDSRVCSNCNTSETPEWRKGPRGPHTLCNACGLQWMKAQKRENEMKSKYEEARKKNSLMRVLNTHGNTTNVNTINLDASRSSVSSSSTIANIVDMSGENDFSGRYYEMETLSSEVSPNLSPMQAVSTPITADAINTLKAMQTISALSHMNHINHINTLNHLNILSTLNVPDSNSPSHYSAHNHTVINHYNTNLNTYSNGNNTNNNSPYSPDLGTPMTRYPPHMTSPQQLYLPLYNTQGTTSPAGYNPYVQIPMKDYTHGSPMATSPPPHPSMTLAPNPLIHPLQSLSHSLSNPLLQPSHTLIPNPNSDDSCIGGGQM